MHTRSRYSALVILVALLAFRCSSPKRDAGTHPVQHDSSVFVLSAEQLNNIPLSMGHVEERILTETIKANGKLDVPPQNLVTVSAPLAGFVKYTELLQGMKVQKGQQIVTLEHPDYIQMQQDFLDAESQLEYLRLEYERQKELAVDNVNSAKTLQLAKSNYVSMKAKSDGLAARLLLINIDPEHLKTGKFSSSINLFAPITGYITEVNVNIGMHVNPTDVMFRIVDNSHLHAEARVFESDIARLAVGQVVRFSLANDAHERTAHVYLIGKEITADRTVRVHCHLDQEDPALIPGMYFHASIQVPGKPFSTLPETAVVNFEGKDYIFIMKSEASHQYEMIEIKKGTIDNGFVSVILPGTVSAQTPVVVNGAYELLSFLKNKGE